MKIANWQEGPRDGNKIFTFISLGSISVRKGMHYFTFFSHFNAGLGVEIYPFDDLGCKLAINSKYISLAMSVESQLTPIHGYCTSLLYFQHY